MLLVSPLIRAAKAVLPPRVAFQIRLRQMERWRTFEHGWLLIDHLIDPTRAAVDVGANEGLYAGKMARFTKNVHCFEPIPWFVDGLRANLPSSVVVHPHAVSDAPGRATLRIPYCDGVELHGTSTVEEANLLKGADRIREVEVQRVTLDEAVSIPVGFIKVDVEGHELAVLRGASRIIENDRPVIMVESEKRHNHDAPESVFSFFSERSYAGLAIYDNRLVSLATFDVSRHQADVSMGKAYANNFIFFPPLP